MLSARFHIAILFTLLAVTSAPLGASPISIESAERSVWARASWYCCPGWPLGAECRTDSSADEQSTNGFEYFWWRADASLRCLMEERVGFWHHCLAGQTSWLNGSEFVVGGRAFAFTEDPAECGFRFRVTFVVHEPCPFRLNGSIKTARYFSPESFAGGASLVGEGTNIELVPECCGGEQSLEETGILAPGRYTMLAYLELGPIGGGDTWMELNLSFGTSTAVQSATWGKIKSLYQ